MSQRVGAQPGEVVVIRSGYASDRLWFAAIQQARAKGRVVRAIRADGSVRVVEPESARDATRAPKGPREQSA